jgi:hypothetical protein
MAIISREIFPLAISMQKTLETTYARAAAAKNIKNASAKTHIFKLP